MNILITDFLAGLLYLLSGSMGLVRHFLLEPKVARTPATPKYLMTVFFGFSTLLLFLGLRFTMAWYAGHPIGASPQAVSLRMLLAGGIFVYMTTLLFDTITRQERLTFDQLLAKLKEL